MGNEVGGKTIDLNTIHAILRGTQLKKKETELGTSPMTELT